jgi:DNA-binding NarL/FixJ family response regulator
MNRIGSTPMFKNEVAHSGGMDVIRILLVDDHDIFLAGLHLLLRDHPGFLVVGQAHNQAEALKAVDLRPDIILLDLDLGGESGLDILLDLMKIADGARVLVLTGVPDSEFHVRAVCLGAMGVVHKLDSPIVLIKAIRKVYAGEAWLNRTMVATAMRQFHANQRQKPDPEKSKIASLTARELDVIAAIGEGLRNKAIAERLFISEKTVRHYLTSIFNKLEVNDRLELIIYAYQHGLAKVPLPTRPSLDIAV